MRKLFTVIFLATVAFAAGCGGGGGGGGGGTSNAPTTYKVTPAVGSGGSVSPSTVQSVNSGATASFTITANSGYIISSVTGCGGVPWSGGNTYTTGVITSDCIVNASFVLPTTAILKLSSQGVLSVGKAVSGFGATLELPSGVTVKNTGGVVDASVVAGSGLLEGSAGTLGPVNYTPATSITKAKLDFTIASTAPAGVGVGEYATINFILNGVSPTAADFSITSFKPIDLSYTDITTLIPVKTLELR